MRRQFSRDASLNAPVPPSLARGAG
jgi:hypothetical protein